MVVPPVIGIIFIPSQYHQTVYWYWYCQDGSKTSIFRVRQTDAIESSLITYVRHLLFVWLSHGFPFFESIRYQYDNFRPTFVATNAKFATCRWQQ
jgi:hypothetical protein